MHGRSLEAYLEPSQTSAMEPSCKSSGFLQRNSEMAREWHLQQEQLKATLIN